MEKNDYSGLSEDFLEGIKNNPYYESELEKVRKEQRTQEKKQNVYQSSANIYQNSANAYQRNDNVYQGSENAYQRNANAYQRNENTYKSNVNVYQSGSPVYQQKADSPKASNAWKWVSIGFVLFAAATIGCCVLGYAAYKNLVYQKVTDVAYEEMAMEDHTVTYNPYTTVDFGEAYAVSDHEKLAGFFHEGYQLCMLPVAIMSTEYIEDAYPMKHLYFRYEENGAVVYKASVMSNEVLEMYARAIGVKEDQLLSSYAGNGYDSAGFLFFCVPKDVENVTLYMEIREEDTFLSVVKEVRYKELAINPYNKEAIEALVQEGGRMQ